MKATILSILVGKRKESAVNVQKLLTTWGCIIKTRLGLHTGTLDECSNNGLVILEIVGADEKREELERKLNLIGGVVAKSIALNLDED
jgi:ribose 5-phosphate isomerase